MTATKYHAVADTFVSVARHGNRWGCFMQDDETGDYAWIGEWLPTKAAAVDYAQQQYPLPAKLVADALFARQAARDARKVQEDYYTAPGFNHARYAELVDARKVADSEWQRAMDRVDANTEAADLYQEAVNPPPAPTPTPGAPLAAPNPTCARCHTVIVAEAGDTCANIPHWQRGAFTYCTEPPMTHQEREAAPCTHCGHRPEDHISGGACCHETRQGWCGCDGYVGPEAAQRADEAELDNTRCAECSAAVTGRDVWIDTDGRRRCTPCHCRRGWQPAPTPTPGAPVGEPARGIALRGLRPMAG